MIKLRHWYEELASLEPGDMAQLIECLFSSDGSLMTQYNPSSHRGSKKKALLD